MFQVIHPPQKYNYCMHSMPHVLHCGHYQGWIQLLIQGKRPFVMKICFIVMLEAEVAFPRTTCNCFRVQRS